jgi:hypothetical protein
VHRILLAFARTQLATRITASDIGAADLKERIVNAVVKALAAQPDTRRKR